MDINVGTLTEKLLRIPRRARIQFLHIYCERIIPLFFTRGLELIIMSVFPADKNPLKVMRDTCVIANKYSFNPHLYTRKDLEWAKEAASSLEGIAFAYSCGESGFLIASAFEELMNCCIDDPEPKDHNPYSECFVSCYTSLMTNCSGKGFIQLNSRINEEMDAFLEAMKKQNWTDDSAPVGTSVTPGWGQTGPPDGWPRRGDMQMWGVIILKEISKAPFDLLGNFFK